MQSASKFQAKQIVCLEHQNTYLYAEVIDIIETRQMCWGRPLLLASGELPILYDLREGADILLPLTLFRPALDTELIPLLVQITTVEDRPVDSAKIAHRQLRAFIQQVWQDHPNNFSSSSGVS
ncbi:hypothetical protein NG798_10415 [Ancylothrix sp. C2]|uniref:hypothetical protein n=1 Tax=Ancylothrix sp. D3o TaxID=2953691 RepID=UPI0021BB3D17|nr:hypothetical protein [Ancylothrix sp. D3o]MCT7950200.1 hypothetical protein [Ancylothrix sp. D3o]